MKVGDEVWFRLAHDTIQHPGIIIDTTPGWVIVGVTFPDTTVTLHAHPHEVTRRFPSPLHEAVWEVVHA